MVRTFVSFFDRTLDFLSYVCSVLLFLLMLAVCADITARYFFNAPFIGLAEISEYTLLYITFLGSAWLLRQEGHIVSDLVINFLPARGKAAAGIVSSIIGVVICVVLIIYGLEVTWTAFEQGLYRRTPLEFPKGPLLAVIPFGASLLLVQFVRRTNSYLVKWRVAGDNGEVISESELELSY